MPSRRVARKAARDADRLVRIGDHPAALAALEHAAAEYRSLLALRAAPDLQQELAAVLEQAASSHAETGDRSAAAAALTERLGLLSDLGEPAASLGRAGLDLAETHLAAGHLLSAATRADEAVRDHDRADEHDSQDAFAGLAAALARNARILAVAGDPDLAAGAADQAARMLLTLTVPTGQQRRLLNDSLVLAVRLHGAAGRTSLAAGAQRLLDRHFPDTGRVRPETERPLSLRAALTAAARLGALGDTGLIDRLCPDPASRSAPPAISARCDPDLAAVALHAVAGAVEILQRSHAPIAWRMATEIHYLLVAAERQGERNLRLNFRDHGPTWLGMMLCLTGTAARSPALGADLAGVLEQLLERMRLRHAAGGHDQAAAERYIDHYRQRHLLGPRHRCAGRGARPERPTGFRSGGTGPAGRAVVTAERAGRPPGRPASTW